MSAENPNTQQRAKMLRLHKGLLLLQNRNSKRKFEILASASARMTVPKAIALWKHNSGVVTIDGALDLSFREQTLNKFIAILKREVHLQRMLTFSELAEFKESSKARQLEPLTEFYQREEEDEGRQVAVNKVIEWKNISSFPISTSNSHRNFFLVKFFKARDGFRRLEAKGRVFARWKTAAQLFDEKLAMSLHQGANDDARSFSLASTMNLKDLGSSLDKQSLSQFQKVLMLQESSKSRLPPSRTLAQNQVTSRRKWNNPKFKTLYCAQSAKLGLSQLKQAMRKKILRDSLKANGPSLNQSKMLYSFRRWARLTNIETLRYKQRRAREILKRLQTTIFHLKLTSFFRWAYFARREKALEHKAQTGEDPDEESVHANFHQIINQNVLMTQSQINSQLQENLDKKRLQIRTIKKTYLVIEMFKNYLRPKYTSKVSEMFGRWKLQVLSSQKVQLRQLDITKDILMDELQQSMKIHETLKDSDLVQNIYDMRCHNCITRTLASGGGLFGDDSDDEARIRRTQTDEAPEPLSDSLPEKNILSKSEKSLQKPLQLFQEEHKAIRGEETHKQNLSQPNQAPGPCQTDPKSHQVIRSGRNLLFDKNKTSDHGPMVGAKFESSGQASTTIIDRDTMPSRTAKQQSKEFSGEDHFASWRTSAKMGNHLSPSPLSKKQQSTGHFRRQFHRPEGEYGGETATDVGIQYIQFIYQDNVKLQQEISEYTKMIIEADQQRAKERSSWEDEIEELERQIALFRE